MGMAETTIPSPDQEKPRGIPWAKSQENTTSIKSRAISSFWFWASRFQTTKLPHFRLLIFAMVLGIRISDSLPQAYTISVKCQVRRVAPRYKASRKRPSAKQWGREPTRAFLFFSLCVHEHRTMPKTQCQCHEEDNPQGVVHILGILTQCPSLQATSQTTKSCTKHKIQIPTHKSKAKPRDEPRGR